MTYPRTPLFTTLFATLAVTSSAWAQTPPDATARRQLVERAISARDANQHAQALDLFQQAGQIQMRPGLRMSIAQEQQALGNAIEACEGATACVTEAQADLTGAGNATALQGCAALVATTCATLGHVRLRLPATVPEGLRLTVQGRVVDRSAGDVITVLPGMVAVTAVAGRQVLFEESVAVQRGETHDVTVRLDAPPTVAVTVAATVAAPPRQQVRAIVVTPPVPVPVPVRAAQGPGIGPWLVLGGGAVALGLSAVFLGMRESAKSSRDAACGVGYCTQAAADFQATAETDNVGMYVALGIGAAAATAGVVWLATGGSSAETAGRTALSVGAMPTRGGVVFGVGGSL